MVTSALVSNHIHDTNAIKDFIRKQLDLLQYSNDRLVYKKFKPEKQESQTELYKRVMSDPHTVRLIKRFKYMRDNGILDKIINDSE